MAGSSRWATLQHRSGPEAPPAGLLADSARRQRTAVAAPGSATCLEIYGPGSTAILVDVVPEQCAAVTAALRPRLRSFGASLGASGALAYLFDSVGLMSWPEGTPDRPRIEAAALGAGAEDVVLAPDGALEVLTAPADLWAVHRSLVQAGLPPALTAVVRRAALEVGVDAGDLRRLLALLQALADLPGVLDVWCNGVPGPGADAPPARLQ